MDPLWPSTIPGTPGNVTPETRISGVDRCVRYQMPGADGARCGSFARMGLPSAVRLPETTQLLLAARSSAYSPTILSASVRTCISATANLRASVDDPSGEAAADRVVAASLPKSTTSYGVTWLVRSANLSGERPFSEARTRSFGHVVLNASARILPITIVSAGVHGRGLY